MRLPAFLGLIQPNAVATTGAGQLYHILFGWSVNMPFLSALVSAILVFAQALMMNWLVNSSRVNPERNWLVPLFYVVFMSCIPGYQFLSPPLVAVTFFPAVYRLLFRMYKSNEITLLAFDIGLLISTAALFYLPVLWILPIILLSMTHLRSLKIREISVFTAGAFVPGFLGWATAFWFNQGGVFRKQHFTTLFEFWDINFQFAFSALVQAIVLAFLLLIILMSYNTYYYKRLIQIQKYNNMLYWLVFTVLAIAFFRNQPQAEHFLLAGTAVGIFLALTFQGIKNKGVAEVFFIALLGLIFSGIFIV